MSHLGWVLFFFWATACEFGYSQQSAPGSNLLPRTTPNEVIFLDEGVTSIAEETLLPFAGYGPRQDDPGIVATAIGGGSRVTYYSAASGDTIRDAYEEKVTSMRCYGFRLLPGEALQIHLSADSSSRMVMRFVPRPVVDAMTSQIHKANLPPRPVRSSGIKIRNVTEHPYQVNLAVSGLPNFPFKLEIKRGKTARRTSDS